MQRKRFGTALLSLCLILGLFVPAYAREAGAPPETAFQAEGDPAGHYALDSPEPGTALLLPRAADIVKSGTCGAEGDNLTWTLDAEGLLTISGKGDMANYITRLDASLGLEGETPPWSRLTVSALRVEEGVASIGENAFADVALQDAPVLPDTLERIGASAFSGCARLRWLDVPDGVTEIGSYAFSGCSSLHELHLPESLTAVSPGAFADCRSLRSVDIPAVSVIGSGAFKNCSSLEKVYFSGTEEEWNAVTAEDGNDALSSCRVLFRQRTVFYDPNGGADNMWNGHTVSGEPFRLPACGHAAPAGQVFNGWLFQDRTYQPGDSLTITENAAVTALWRSELDPVFSVSVTGSFDEYPGKGDYPAGTAVTLRAGTREGWAFDRWDVSGLEGLENLQKPELAFTMPENAVTAEAVWTAEPIRGPLSKEEIRELLRSAPLEGEPWWDMSGGIFDQEPSLTEPYSPGKVSAARLQAAADRLNALRALAGLPTVELDADLCENAQYGALAMAFLGDITHYPAEDYPGEFARLPEDIQKEAAAAASTSNLHAGRSLTWSVDGFMDDSDAGNISRVGHRRWQLNPEMGKVGFGYAAAPDTLYRQYVVEKVFDRSGTVPDYEFVGWPAAGYFPSTLAAFNSKTAWSASLNPDRYRTPDISAVTVTLTGGGKTWTFGKDADGGYFNVDTAGYGVGNCIIFRPDGVSAYEGVYTVRIDGLRDSGGRETALAYEVEFFDPFPPSAVTVAGSAASLTGAGAYRVGRSVTLRAGTRRGFAFDGWTITGVTLDAEALRRPDLTFVMPEGPVSAEAHWEELPLPSVPVSIASQSAWLTSVQADPEILASLDSADGRAPLVLASPADGRGAAEGLVSARSGRISFTARLDPGGRLFFLDPDTFIPLAKASTL